MESFRCIHASRLLLDYQLHGLELPGFEKLAAGLRGVIEDATLIAFEQIVDACLVHQVDCLLLSGDCFDPDDCGLRGPAALIRGIRRLADRDIAVILQSGHPDQSPGQWSSWPPGLRFPPNAHRLGPAFENSVLVARQGRLVATIAETETHPEPHHGNGWQIIFPTPSGSRTVQLKNDCAPAQGIREGETGPHGCVLIEFDADGASRQTFIATAPVRWQRCDLAIPVEMTRDDLLQEMASVLEQTPREPCEKIWLVDWEVSGNGQLLDSLSEKQFRDELLAELTDLDPVPLVWIHSHSVRVNHSAQAALSIASQDDLASEYAVRLQQRFARPETALHEILAGSALAGGPWEVKMESLFAELDAGEVAHDARRMAMHWFAASEELSS